MQFSQLRRRSLVGASVLAFQVLLGGSMPLAAQQSPSPSTPTLNRSPLEGLPPTPRPPVEEDLPLSRPIPLEPVEIPNLGAIGLDEQLFGPGGDRANLLRSIDNSLRYIQTPAAATAYASYNIPGVSRDRVAASLRRFRQLVATATSAQGLQQAIAREFLLYRSIGRDQRGEVFFTSYYEPIYRASRTRTEQFRYPLYGRPADLDRWTQPMPTREQLEGKDGRGEASPLRGQELFWLDDRMDAFLVHIQGSARLQLPDGRVATVGYADHNGYPYVSVGRELAKDGRLPLDGMTLPVMIDFFRRNPTELDNYLPRNSRFIFFRETHGAPATGSLGLPVTPERSIATDRSIMPAGALALVHTSLPFRDRGGQMVYRTVSRFVLDQDTGSAMIGPGRVDYFMGTGVEAGNRAGVTGSRGSLYYLLLR
jgi:membrane-bound lytic murein transglycosylase A